MLCLGFNSIKVRFERVTTLFDRVPFQFQFHKGTIRTQNSKLMGDFRFKFQFHKGTIRTLYRAMEQAVHSRFNSIKVRLELPDVSKHDVCPAFQFHKGTIRT